MAGEWVERDRCRGRGGILSAIELADLAELIEGRYISARKHPDADLWIYNYTPKTQYEGLWNETTKTCRGLILGPNREIMARPFRKFFNWGEPTGEQFPAEPFEVFDKVDGSLGILYWVGDEPRIASRGSFTSDQAARATQMLGRYRDTCRKLDRRYTYLFEMIYPENRIVVDYGNREDIVLLAAIESDTARELPHDDLIGLGFTVVDCFGIGADVDALPLRDGAEGFVLRWPSTNQRVKVKYAEYLKIHRLIFGLTERRLWEMLRDGEDVGALREKIPDEFYAWYTGCTARLTSDYDAIVSAARDFIRLNQLDRLSDRREVAGMAKNFEHPFIVFAMIDGKPYADAIWKLLRPEHATPFCKLDEDVA